jgi:predicted O-methyltransferase YrrM
MVEEFPIFKEEDRSYLDRDIIDSVTIPLGDRYDDGVFQEYFSDYCGMTKKYLPKKIFEIGVRFGTCALCMLLGLQAAGETSGVIYRGCDDESYDYDSSSKANRNFQSVVPWADAKCLKHNSFSGLPEEVKTLAPFDLIHIDGNHDKHGVLNDIGICWPILANGGIVIFDDATHPPIREAIEEFLSRHQTDASVLIRCQRWNNARGHAYLQKIQI